MASTPTPQQDYWKNFRDSFRKTNFEERSTANVAKNNIKAIDDFLIRFMSGDDRAQLEKDQARTETANKTPLPSYNVRTPHVDVWINGVHVIKQGQTDAIQVDFRPRTPEELANLSPEELINSTVPNLDVFFKDLNLDMAFGGPLGAVKGTLTLFSRDPLDFLSFLYDFASDLDSCDGLPSASIQFGWNIASPQGATSPNNGSTLLSPKLDFLVMNVAMSDPSGEMQGSTFTLTLQDTGSALYDNAAGDFAVISEYPQQQLRIIVEKCMGVRLFTLDDFLGDQSEAIASTRPDYADYTKLDPNDAGDLIILNQLAEKLKTDELNNTGTSTEAEIRTTKSGVTITAKPDTATTAEFTEASVDSLSLAGKKELIGRMCITEAHPRDFGWQSSGKTISMEKYRRDAKVYAFMKETLAFYPAYANVAQFQLPENGGVVGLLPRLVWEVNGSIVTYEGNPAWYYPVRPTLLPAVEHLSTWLFANKQRELSHNYMVDPVAIYTDAAKAAIRIYGPLFTLGTALKADVQRIFKETEVATPSIIDVIKKYNTANADMVRNALKSIYDQTPSLFTRTFFLNGMCPSLRMNSKSFRESIESLVSRIQCRWYPVSNSQLQKELDSSTAQATDAEVYEAYKKWKAEVERNPSSPTVDSLKAAYDTAKNRKAYGCRLIYVSGVPKSFKNTSDKVYINDSDLTDGAFVLIPNINPLHINDSEIPLIYGPGGSNYPYLYGGAQNIKQVLLDKSGRLPSMYGEVIDAKVNFNSMTALIAGNFSEETALAEAGQRMSKVTSLPDATVTAKETPEQKAAKRASRKEKLEAWMKKYYPDLTGTTYEAKCREVIEANLANGVRKTKNFAQYATVYQGRRKLYNADPVNTPASERTFTNPVHPKESAVDFLAQRLGNMLYSATSVSLAVMGDPFLVRQGIGAFELLHYFVDKKGTGLRFNYLLSGTYLVQSVNHSISLGSYTTNIKAFKIPPVEGTFSKQLDKWRVKGVQNIGSTSVALNPEERTALEDILTTSIDLEDFEAHSATRITAGTVINTEVNSTPANSLAEINKFYFGIG